MSHIAVSIGLIFLAAAVGGRAAAFFHIPRIVGYLLGGLLMGPSVLGLIPASHLESLHPLLDLAMAFIMFSIGGEFKLSHFRKIGRRILPLSIGEILCTFTLVSVGLLLLGQRGEVAFLLGALAVATAPVTTVIVLREYDSEGPVTDDILALVGINNAVSIIAFEMVFLLIYILGGTTQEASSTYYVSILWSLLGSIVYGISGGIIISYINLKIGPRERTAVLLTVMFGIIGLSTLSNVPYLLSFLIMGATVANISEFAREISKELESLSAPIYVLFFVVSGGTLHLENLKMVGIAGVGYVLFRGLGKYFGSFLGAMRNKKSSIQEKHYTGLGLFSQAGAAIALALIAIQRDPVLGKEVMTVILSAVIIFEIAGPILLRTAIVRSGEVKIINLMDLTPASAYGFNLRVLLTRLFESLGLKTRGEKKKIEDLQVSHLMRRNIPAVHATDSLNALLSLMEHSRHTFFPVIDDNNYYQGLISLEDIRDALYDPILSKLVIAADLAGNEELYVTPQDSLETALELFKSMPVNCLPVVNEKDEKLLVGLLEQRDLLNVAGKHL